MSEVLETSFITISWTRMRTLRLASIAIGSTPHGTIRVFGTATWPEPLDRVLPALTITPTLNVLLHNGDPTLA